MPLRAGKESLAYNIKELSETGRPRDQVLAIALKEAGLTKPRRPKKKGTKLSAENP